MNFAYHDGSLILHSAQHGEKIRIIKNNPDALFAVEDKVKLDRSDLPCNFGMKYRSVIGKGKISFLTGTNEKADALKIFAEKYSTQNVTPFQPSQINAVIVMMLKISEVTGKQSG